MDEEIKIGLDFGTHQTKICIQIIPDEGHGLPEYEFMKFADLMGEVHYFIPSVVQINKDDTLSYGYCDPNNEKEQTDRPILRQVTPDVIEDIDEEADNLFFKYAPDSVPDVESLTALRRMLEKKNAFEQAFYEKNRLLAQEEYEKALESFHHQRNVFRYFKQATFAEYPWEGKYAPQLLCVWYLTYIIFLLEERFGQNFSINMGVPTDDKTFEQKKRLAVQILSSAYHLVEKVYQNDMDSFLKEKVDSLQEKTILYDYSDEDKEEYKINVFPEAYASLIGLTSRGKLSEGMSINADIGGGTTDVSFFIINDGLPKIYKYWSIPRGLNYIAEQSGFDYSEGDFMRKAHEDIIEKFNNKKKELVYNLELELLSLLRKYNTGIDKSRLNEALKDRILVYNGGGSIYPSIATPIFHFTDVKTVNSDLWTEEIMHEKNSVMKLANILTTSFGLSLSDDDQNVVLCDFNSLFKEHSKERSNEKEEIDKDVC